MSAVTTGCPLLGASRYMLRFTDAKHAWDDEFPGNVFPSRSCFHEIAAKLEMGLSCT